MSNETMELLVLMGQHLRMVLIATIGATAIALPLGIAASRRPMLGRTILAVAGVLQTVPSLALFGFLIPLPWIGGIGAHTAIIALMLYALLPIVRGTLTGITGVDAFVRDAAIAMGMTPRQRLFQVELPLALPVIVSGLRVSTVTTVGVATVAAAIGAGGLGSYIFRGLRMYDMQLLLRGALPAAAMAILLDFALGLLATGLDPRERRTRHRVRLLAAVTMASVVAIIGAGAWATQRIESNAQTPKATNAPVVRVGSKDFTEQRILGELIAQVLESRGVRVERKFELSGTLCHQALVAGQLDMYAEYTGTAYSAILKHEAGPAPQVVRERVRQEYREKFSFDVSDSLGFRNDFAILVRAETARDLSLQSISDVARHGSTLQAAFGQDFLSRADGFPGLSARYGIKFAKVPREMDLSLSIQALASREVDIIAGNSTDGLIERLQLVQLEDDRNWFPPYEAVLVARLDALEKVPEIKEVMTFLAGRISTKQMRQFNLQVDGDKQPVERVVAQFLENIAKPPVNKDP